MKNFRFRYSIISLAAIVALGLGGCGGGDSSSDDSSNNSTAITGKAIDGYLVGSTVCIDLNRDGVCNGNEPTTKTDKNGRYTLSIPSSIQKVEGFALAPILVYDGVDKATLQPFTGKLRAPNKASSLQINVTPITTLVHHNFIKQITDQVKIGKPEEILQESEELVKKALAIPENIDISADPIELEQQGEDTLLEKSLALQKSIETLAIATDQNDSQEEIYAALAKNVDTNTTSLDALLDEAKEDLPQEAQKVVDVAKKIVQKVETLTQTVDTNASTNKSVLVEQLVQKDLDEIKETIQTQGDVDLTQIVDINTSLDPQAIRFEGFEYQLNNVLDLGYSDSEIESIIEKLPADFQPEDLFDKTQTLKDINGLEDLYAKIVAKKEELGLVTPTESIKDQSAKLTLTLPETFYDFYREDHNNDGVDEVGYSEVAIQKDYSVNANEYYFDIATQKWIKYKNEDIVLTKDGWQENVSGKIKKIDDTTFEMSSGEKVTITQEESIAGKYFVSSIDLQVEMPKGATVRKLYIQNNQRYELDHQELNHDTNQAYSSFEAFMQNQCDNKWFEGDNNGGISFGDCNSIGNTKGTLYIVEDRDENGSEIVSKNGGTWEFREVYGEKILVILPNEAAKQYLHNDEDTEIFALYNGKVYKGELKQAEKEDILVFNTIAANTIKKAIQGQVANINQTQLNGKTLYFVYDRVVNNKVYPVVTKGIVNDNGTEVVLEKALPNGDTTPNIEIKDDYISFFNENYSFSTTLKEMNGEYINEQCSMPGGDDLGIVGVFFDENNAETCMQEQDMALHMEEEAMEEEGL